MSGISIVTVAIDSPEWVELLVKSVRYFTTFEHEIIVIDNGSLPDNLTWIEAQEDVKLVKLPHNIGHGSGMDLGTQVSEKEFVCVLDIDSHAMRRGWDHDLYHAYCADPKTRLVGVVGPEHKPLHPPLFFYRRNFVLENNISFRYLPRLSTDTAQKAYWDILALGFKVERLHKAVKTYGCIGDEIQVGNAPAVYHHWYGTRFCEHNPTRIKKTLDGYSLEDHLKNKAQLFDVPEVKEILAS